MGEETRVLSVGQFKSKVAYYNERKRLVAEEGYVLVGSTKTSVTLKKTTPEPAPVPAAAPTPTPAPAPAPVKPAPAPVVPVPVKQWVATEFNGNSIVLKFTEPVKEPLATVAINQDGSMTIKKVAPKRNPTPVRKPQPAPTPAPVAAKPAAPVATPAPAPTQERSVSKPRGGRRR